MKSIWYSIVFLLIHAQCSGEVYHNSLSQFERKRPEMIWTKTHISPFDTLLVSWNAQRPLQGAYHIEFALFAQKWSPWFSYAIWSAASQRIGASEKKIEQFLRGKQATGFRIRIRSKKNTPLKQVWALHATPIRNNHRVRYPSKKLAERIHVPVKGLSQMALDHDEATKMCSPTSTTAVIRMLSNQMAPRAPLNPLHFAAAVRDTSLGIYGYGIWALNTAQAAHELGKDWNCFVTRLGSFDEIIMQLRRGYPVIVSVVGPLPGGATPYAKGHLLVVEGYDPLTKSVLCMDPAFSSDSETHVQYPLADFMRAWGVKRQGLAYIFQPTNIT
jgi:hypothetical protein